MRSGHTGLRIDYILFIAEAIFLAFIAMSGYEAFSGYDVNGTIGERYQFG